MKLIVVLLASLTLGACVAKHSRDQNVGEKTLVSNDVHDLVLAAEDGAVDIREHENVRCKRIRIVGTHTVKRLCYTTEEDAAQARETQEKYYSRFGAQKNLDRTAGGN